MKSVRLIFLAIAALLFIQCSNDEDSTTPTEPQTMEEQFSYEMFNNNSVNLPYREAKFNQEKTGVSALVILLHGGSSRGSDNKAQLEPQAVKNVFEYLKAADLKAILLVPQCPENRLWNETSEVATPMSAIVLNLINNFTLSHNIDKTRIYMLGYSAGGSGAWRMISDNPKLFAAAMPAVATARLVVADNVKQTPVYAVAGSEDALMSAQEIQSFVDILKAKGGEVKFDILQGKDHEGACGEAFSTERLNWIFEHTRE